MKILVTGANGQLAFDVVQELKRRSIPCRAVGKEECDITNMPHVMELIENYKPDAVIHCAAYTAVDKAEQEEELCTDVNYRGSANVAAACKKVDAKMLFVSTDYVFGGTNNIPLEVDDPKNPLNVYGESKLNGENSVQRLCPKSFIVRTSWVFGLNGANFVKTMLRLAKDHPCISVVNDQIGSPTYTADLAPLLCNIVMSEKYGVYHATNEGFCSWYDFAKKIMELTDNDVKIVPVSTAEYPTAARRPLNSRLSKSSLDEAGFLRLPTWEDALKRYLSALAIANESGVLG